MYKKLLKLLDRNRNKKLDWYEVLFLTPDIYKLRCKAEVPLIIDITCFALVIFLSLFSKIIVSFPYVDTETFFTAFTKYFASSPQK